MSRGNTSIDTRDDLLSDSNRVDMVHVKAIAEPRDSSCDLVELDALLASVWKKSVSSAAFETLDIRESRIETRHIPRFLTYITGDICRAVRGMRVKNLEKVAG